VNAAEAESRRCARFFPFGHTPAEWVSPPFEVQPECPLTLDLRRVPAVQSVMHGDPKNEWESEVAPAATRDPISVYSVNPCDSMSATHICRQREFGSVISESSPDNLGGAGGEPGIRR